MASCAENVKKNEDCVNELFKDLKVNKEARMINIASIAELQIQYNKLKAQNEKLN